MQLFCDRVRASVVGTESSHFETSSEEDGKMCHSVETHPLSLAVAKRGRRKRRGRRRKRRRRRKVTNTKKSKL